MATAKETAIEIAQNEDKAVYKNFGTTGSPPAATADGRPIEYVGTDEADPSITYGVVRKLYSGADVNENAS
jgi:hypothetical protein